VPRGKVCAKWPEHLRELGMLFAGSIDMRPILRKGSVRKGSALAKFPLKSKAKHSLGGAKGMCEVKWHFFLRSI